MIPSNVIYRKRTDELKIQLLNKMLERQVQHKDKVIDTTNEKIYTKKDEKNGKFNNHELGVLKEELQYLKEHTLTQKSSSHRKNRNVEYLENSKNSIIINSENRELNKKDSFFYSGSCLNFADDSNNSSNGNGNKLEGQLNTLKINNAKSVNSNSNIETADCSKNQNCNNSKKENSISICQSINNKWYNLNMLKTNSLTKSSNYC